jgi:hypothetical protein
VPVIFGIAVSPVLPHIEVVLASGTPPEVHQSVVRRVAVEVAADLVDFRPARAYKRLQDKAMDSDRPPLQCHPLIARRLAPPARRLAVLRHDQASVISHSTLITDFVQALVVQNRPPLFFDG